MTNTEKNSYMPINADPVKNRQEQRKQEGIYAADPNTNKAYTNAEMEQQIGAANIDPSGMSAYSQVGGYTKDRSEAVSGGGTGEKTDGYKDGSYYYYPGIDREVKNGNSGADEHHLSDAEYEYVQHCKQMYAQAQTQDEKNYWHSEAEKTRARYDYAGGTDGSGYYTLGSLGLDANSGTNGGAASNGGGTSAAGGSASDLRSMLDSWKQAAQQQSDGKVDYAVSKAVADLERALEDAKPQFKEQAESVDISARQAMDNSALYAEFRGDKGGIGQEQYNSIQNTQAQNHLAVQQAQTKVATDTQRQIADLRAQGEFEKADAALEITQTYLSQLIGLEQWAAEYNLSVEQFNESVRQWEDEYNMAMQKLQISQNQWQAEFDAEQELNDQNKLAGIGQALLSAGIPLTSEQMTAMGLTAEQASLLLWKQQFSSAQKGQSADSESGGDGAVMDYDGLFAAAMKSGYPKSFIANNYKKYGFSSGSGLYDDYRDWQELSEELREEKTLNAASILDLGVGGLSQGEVMNMVIAGVLEVEPSGSGYMVRWADGWDAGRYRGEVHRSGINGLL